MCRCSDHRSSLASLSPSSELMAHSKQQKTMQHKGPVLQRPSSCSLVSVSVSRFLLLSSTQCYHRNSSPYFRLLCMRGTSTFLSSTACTAHMVCSWPG